MLQSTETMIQIDLFRQVERIAPDIEASLCRIPGIEVVGPSLTDSRELRYVTSRPGALGLELPGVLAAIRTIVKP